MKSKEELNALKEEVEALNKKLAELTEEELEQVSGGNITVTNGPVGQTTVFGLVLSDINKRTRTLYGTAGGTAATEFSYSADAAVTDLNGHALSVDALNIGDIVNLYQRNASREYMRIILTQIHSLTH